MVTSPRREIMIKTLKRFLESTSGNFAIPTAFVVGPILMGVTLAVDYSELVRR
jgi:Flp pilus assembly protein TadG